MCRLAARMRRQVRGNATTTIAAFDSARFGFCVG